MRHNAGLPTLALVGETIYVSPTIAKGFAADLTVVRGDPAKNIRVLGDVRYALRSGRVI